MSAKKTRVAQHQHASCYLRIARDGAKHITAARHTLFDAPAEQVRVAEVPLLSLLKPSSQHLMTSPTPAHVTGVCAISADGFRMDLMSPRIHGEQMWIVDASCAAGPEITDGKNKRCAAFFGGVKLGACVN
jgi:hypothetical protein